MLEPDLGNAGVFERFDSRSADAGFFGQLRLRPAFRFAGCLDALAEFNEIHGLPRIARKWSASFPRVNFKQDIAAAFLHGFEHETQTTEGTCNEDICSHFIRNYKRSNFYDQIQNSPLQNS